MNSMILMVLDKLLQKKENLQYVLFGKVSPPLKSLTGDI